MLNMGDLRKTLRRVNSEDESAMKLQIGELTKWINQTKQKLNGVKDPSEAKKQISLTTDEIKAFMNYEAIETLDSMKKTKFLISTLDFVMRQLQEKGMGKADLHDCLMSAILNLDCLAKVFEGKEEEKKTSTFAKSKDFRSVTYHPSRGGNTDLVAAGLGFSGDAQTMIREMDQLKQENKTLKAILKKEKYAKEDALTRLSHFAADKMKIGNPGITDLSDPNRPSKLAEDFGELYCNEWTDALEYLQQKATGGNSSLNAKTIRVPDRPLEIQEKGSVEQLFDALKNCYNKCKEAADQQRHAILEAVFHKKEGDLKISEIPKKVEEAVREFQRQIGSETSKFIPKVVSLEVLEEMRHVQGEKMKIYMGKCIQLCWLMRIQFPPIHLEFNIKPETDFDANLYTRYLNSGRKVLFPVWPIMLLHEQNGPVLKKGVVECTKGK